MAAKPTPERKSRSGSYVHEAQRGADGGAETRLTIRCSSELVERVRRLSRASGRSLAQVLALGADAVEAMPPRELTLAEDEAACRADSEYERMRDDDIREQ